MNVAVSVAAMQADFYRNVLPWLIAFFIPEGLQRLARIFHQLLRKWSSAAA